MTLRRAGRRGARWTGAVTVGLFLGPAVLALALARHYNLGVAETLITMLLSGSALGTLYLGWRSNRDGQGDAAKASLPDIADELAKALGKQANAAAAAMGLNDPCPLPVSWTAADPALTDPWITLRSLVADGAGWRRRPPPAFWLGGPDRLAGSGRDLVKRLDRLPTGRLVVLGESGAGKTGLMVKLVLDLLDRRQPGDPVPVLISVADWDPSTDDLLQWFKGKMTRDYPGLDAPPPPGNDEASRIGALIGAKLIVPVLDGLDEIPDKRRRLAIAEINAGYPAGGRLVVTCRTDAYRRAVRPPHGTRTTLRGAAGIELRPLKPADVTGYLRQEANSVAAENRWAPVIAALRTATPLARVLSTPLMVGLASAIYNPRSGEHVGEVPDPADLCKFSRAADIERHLLGARVREAYRSVDHKHRPRWSAEQAERWLTFLAEQAQQAGNSGDIAWWRFSQSLPRRLAGLVVGGASLLMFGLAGWFAGGRGDGIGYGLAYAVVFGLAGGLSFGFRSSAPSRVQIRFRGAYRTILRRWAFGTVIGLLFAFIVRQPAVLAAGTAVGLVFGAIGWMRAPAQIDQEPSPAATLRRDRAGTLGTGLLAGLALGTIGGLDVAARISGAGAWSPGVIAVATGVLICGSAGAFLGKLEYGWMGAIAYGVAGGTVGLGATAWRPLVSGAGPGLGYGLTFGLGIALAIMAPRAWGSFTISRVVLALRGKLPWRIMTFLDDARERGLLRQLGPVYQFRHAKLCEHLASSAAEATRRSAAAPAATLAAEAGPGTRAATAPEMAFPEGPARPLELGQPLHLHKGE